MARRESDVVTAMKRVVALLQPSLKRAGFRKRHHTFNRPAENGVIQVVNFQLGQYPIGAGYVVPGLRENLYGLFTVNLGVFVDEVYRTLHRSVPPDFVQDSHCEFRVRLSELEGRRSDRWWPLDSPSDQLACELGTMLESLALPWFEVYDGRDKIIGHLRQGSAPPGWPLRGAMAVAVMLCTAGDLSGATEILSSYLADQKREPKNPGHGDFVREVARALGLQLVEASPSH